MLSSQEIQGLVDEIEALTDKELIAEAERLRDMAPPEMNQQLKAKWSDMITETAAVLGRRFARPGARKEARGRLRGFCRNRRQYCNRPE